MPHFEFNRKTRDGLIVYEQGWNPDTPVKAVVCLIHGVGEHSSRYAHVGDFLNQHQYAVFAFDHRGHGKSQGRRGHISCCETAMADIEDHLNLAEEKYPGVPRILYGHSMGGNLVINYGLRKQPRLSGIVATAPMLRLAFEPSKLKKMTARLMIKCWPTLSLSNGLNTEDISRDPEVVKHYDEDPLTHDRVTPCFLNLIQAGEWALNHASEFTLPLLVMHGSLDHITSPENSRYFAEAAGECCMLKIWDGLYHEIHNEPEKAQVLSTMVNWMDEQLEKQNVKTRLKNQETRKK
jgi:acylglycerol lipase